MKLRKEILEFEKKPNPEAVLLGGGGDRGRVGGRTVTGLH